MRDVNKILTDSQEFISNVRAFQKKQEDLEKEYNRTQEKIHNEKKEIALSLQEEEEGEPDESNGDRCDFGDSSFGSFDIGFSDSVEVKKSNTKPTRKKKVKSQIGPPTPVGNSEYISFPSFDFTPPSRIEENFRADLLTFIETFYFIQKRLPFVRELDQKFAKHPGRPSKLQDWTPLLEGINQSLSNRGISPYSITDDSYIDPKFAWAVTLVVNISDKRTLSAKLKEAGITTKEWTALLRKKSHYEYYTTRIDQVFNEDLRNDAKLAIARSIQNGDLNAVKYYNEWMDIYRKESINITNNTTDASTRYIAEPVSAQMITTVLSAIMEILASYVSSEILVNIASEIRKNETVRKAIEVRSSEPV